MTDAGLTPIPSEPTPLDAFVPGKRPGTAALEAVIKASTLDEEKSTSPSLITVDITNIAAVRADVSRSQIAGSVASQERRMAELRIASIVQTRDAIQGQIAARKSLYDADRAALAEHARKIEAEFHADVDALMEQDRSAHGVLTALSTLVESCDKISGGVSV